MITTVGSYLVSRLLVLSSFLPKPPIKLSFFTELSLFMKGHGKYKGI